MVDYYYLKKSYIASILTGLPAAPHHEDAKRGNELLHAICDKFIDSSYCSEADKLRMKLELSLVKTALDIEIDACFRGRM